MAELEGILGFTVNEGLTKRELFAAMALQGMLADSETIPTLHALTGRDRNKTDRELAINAVRFADSLIAALNESEPASTISRDP